MACRRFSAAASLRKMESPAAPPVFVMSYKTWKGVFHEDPKILGKTLTIDGEPRTLVGVMPQRFQAYGLQAEIWIPITRSRDTPRADEESQASVLARLKPGVTLEAASADLDLIVKRLALLHPDDFPKHFTARVAVGHGLPLGTPRGCHYIPFRHEASALRFAGGGRDAAFDCV